MDEIKISVQFMKGGVALAIPLVVFGLLMHVVKNRLVEFFFTLLKVFYYGALAVLMLKYVEVKELREVDFITAFTCVFCGLECGDNLNKLLGMIIQFIKDFGIFKRDK